MDRILNSIHCCFSLTFLFSTRKNELREQTCNNEIEISFSHKFYNLHFTITSTGLSSIFISYCFKNSSGQSAGSASPINKPG